MQQQQQQITESLLVRQENNREENGDVDGDGRSVAFCSVTPTLALSIFVSACFAFSYGNAYGYSSPTQTSIMKDLGLSVSEFSFFSSILDIGAILGALVSGSMTDLLGRKLTMWILNILYVSGWLAIAFTKVAWQLDLGRFVLGFIKGISNYLVSVYIAEITPKNLRGKFTVITPLMTCWGMSFINVVGLFVSWRTLAIISTVPALLSLLILFFIPESPRWLAKVGRDRELEASLVSLRGKKVDTSHEATDIKDLVESLKSVSSEGVFDVFQKNYIRPLLIVGGLLTLSGFGGINAFAYYSDVIFVSAGVSSMVGLIALSVTQSLVCILGLILIDKSGRRPLLLVSSAGLCFSSFLTGLSFLLKDYKCWTGATPILALIGVLMYMGSYALAAGIPWLLLAELFPVNVKGSAGSICSFLSSFTGWAVAYLFSFLDEWNSAGTFFIFSAFCCAYFILTAKMVPETKGRTLEEIQASIIHSSL